MCDSLCVLGTDALVFAKNSDRPPGEPQVVETFAPRAAGGTISTQYLEIPDAGSRGFVGSRPTWLWGVEHGYNAAGVVIGNEKIWTTDNPRRRPAALLGMDLVRLGLERAASAEQALEILTELIERYGQGGSGEEGADEPYDSSFLIADVTGAWVLETCNRRWAARSAPTAAALSNRVSLTTDWSRASADVAPGTDIQSWRLPSIPTTIADHRLDATTAGTERAGRSPDPAAIVATLRDHGTGPWGEPMAAASQPSRPLPSEVGDDHRGVTVCMHVRGIQATTAAMVVAVDRHSPESVRAWFALGSPCASIYVPTFPRVALPPMLSDPTMWHRFAALRDRVEREDGVLSEVRDRFAPVEDALWVEAGRIESDDVAGQAAFINSVASRVEPALAQLGI
ncbi:MAG: C69 family dipeptidase [Acidimicrobiia bacterium]|nr:C69 family dipeptidase [Acidimicrobiia bacterium]